MSFLHRIAHWFSWNGCVVETRQVGPIGHWFVVVRCVACDEWREIAHSSGCWCGDESNEGQEG